MLVVTGVIILDPETRDAAIMLATWMARETRQEEGCLAYAFYSDIEDPNRFRIYEEWKDSASLEAHFRTEHMERFRQGLTTLKIKSFDIKELDIASVTEH